MMQHTRRLLRENNAGLQEGRRQCGHLEEKFNEALSQLRKDNPEMADLFEEHHETYEHFGYQTELFSYVQGFIDCMQLLSGMGALSGIHQEKITEYLKQYPMTL